MQNADLDILIDREKIRDCLARLSRGEDRRDAGLIKTCYWPDATDHYIGSMRGDYSETFFK